MYIEQSIIDKAVKIRTTVQDAIFQIYKIVDTKSLVIDSENSKTVH